MKKFEKVVIWNEESNVGSLKLIGDLIDSKLNSDWSYYDDYEEVSYEWDLNDEYDVELIEGVSLEDIKEFVGDGICIEMDFDDNIWYNVSIKDDKLLVDFINLEI